MNHLLSGVAIAAALAIAAPVWAQAPTPTAPPAPRAPAAAAPAAPMASMPAPSAGKQRHHRRPMRHMARRGGMRGGEAGMTDQLNREELMRVQGGPPMAAPPPPSMQGPRPSGH